MPLTLLAKVVLQNSTDHLTNNWPSHKTQQATHNTASIPSATPQYSSDQRRTTQTNRSLSPRPFHWANRPVCYRFLTWGERLGAVPQGGVLPVLFDRSSPPPPSFRILDRLEVLTGDLSSTSRSQPDVEVSRFVQDDLGGRGSEAEQRARKM